MLIVYVRGQKHQSIKPSADAESGWVEHSDELANQTLFPTTNSWYMGANIEGKTRRLLAYVGGVDVYRGLCDDVKASQYEAFELA